MVDKFKRVLERLEADMGSVRFFGIFKMDDITDKWTVLISASWSDDNSFDVFKYIVDQIRPLLTEEEFSNIARIGIFTSNEHLIDLLLNYKAGSQLSEEQVNGNIIHEGYIIKSTRDVDLVVEPI